MRKQDLKVWKTLKLGVGYESAEDFLVALEEVGCGIDDLAIELIESPEFKASEVRTSVDLVRISVRELGFARATVEDIYGRARELGLRLCPIEVGPQLRLQYYTEQMRAGEPEALWIGMGTVNTKFDWFLRPTVFCLTCNRVEEELGLDVRHVHRCGYLRDEGQESDVWVFVKE